MMPGKILPFQDNSARTISNMKQLVNAPITLLVNLDNTGQAKGSLFLDGGESISELDNYNYEWYNFVFANKAIQVQLNEGNRGTQDGYTLDSLKILNAESLNETSVACYPSISDKLKPVDLSIEYIGADRVLKISGSGAPVKLHDIHSIHLAADGELNVCDQKHF
jgi:hypothetical protein